MDGSDALRATSALRNGPLIGPSSFISLRQFKQGNATKSSVNFHSCFSLRGPPSRGWPATRAARERRRDGDHLATGRERG
jgi:hypothetical protein